MEDNENLEDTLIRLRGEMLRSVAARAADQLRDAARMGDILSEIFGEDHKAELETSRARGIAHIIERLLEETSGGNPGPG